MSDHHDTLLRVRYAETDQMGYVYYGNYYTYFEVGRVEFMRARGVAYKDMEIADDSFIVVAESNSTRFGFSTTRFPRTCSLCAIRRRRTES